MGAGLDRLVRQIAHDQRVLADQTTSAPTSQAPSGLPEEVFSRIKSVVTETQGRACQVVPSAPIAAAGDPIDHALAKELKAALVAGDPPRLECALSALQKKSKQSKTWTLSLAFKELTDAPQPRWDLNKGRAPKSDEEVRRATGQARCMVMVGDYLVANKLAISGSNKFASGADFHVSGSRALTKAVLAASAGAAEKQAEQVRAIREKDSNRRLASPEENKAFAGAVLGPLVTLLEIRSVDVALLGNDRHPVKETLDHAPDRYVDHGANRWQDRTRIFEAIGMTMAEHDAFGMLADATVRKALVELVAQRPGLKHAIIGGLEFWQATQKKAGYDDAWDMGKKLVNPFNVDGLLVQVRGT